MRRNIRLIVGPDFIVMPEDVRAMMEIVLIILILFEIFPGPLMEDCNGDRLWRSCGVEIPATKRTPLVVAALPFVRFSREGEFDLLDPICMDDHRDSDVPLASSIANDVS